MHHRKAGGLSVVSQSLTTAPIAGGASTPGGDGLLVPSAPLRLKHGPTLLSQVVPLDPVGLYLAAKSHLRTAQELRAAALKVSAAHGGNHRVYWNL
jgi:hypothetical protein